MLKRRDKKKKRKRDYGCPAFSFFFFFFLSKLRNNKDDTNGTEEQLTQGLWVCWSGGASESSRTKGRPRLVCSRMRLRSCTDRFEGRLVQNGRSYPLATRVRPSIQQCFHHWATDVLVWQVRENYLALQLFFFFFSFLPPLKCWDLILMLFCVVLYFHAKILLYLNVFILLNVFKILVIIS